MADKTLIEWTDASWNPTTGCSKVSAGCKNCYAERLFPRVYGRDRAFTDVQLHPDRLHHPLRWKEPRRVFVNSMSDLFHEDVPEDFVDQVFSIMAAVRRHQFQVLTKRPERARAYIARVAAARPHDDVHQAVFDLADVLAEAPFAWPLPQALGRLGWLIAGGESGPRARPPHPAWFRSARDQCAAAFVPFFFKRCGEASS